MHKWNKKKPVKILLLPFDVIQLVKFNIYSIKEKPAVKPESFQKNFIMKNVGKFIMKSERKKERARKQEIMFHSTN